MRSQNAKHWAQNWPADQRTLIRIINSNGKSFIRSSSALCGNPAEGLFFFRNLLTKPEGVSNIGSD